MTETLENAIEQAFQEGRRAEQKLTDALQVTTLKIETGREEAGDPGQTWIADIPALPGVMTFGSTEEDARIRVKALALRVVAEQLEHQELRTDGVFFVATEAPRRSGGPLLSAAILGAARRVIARDQGLVSPEEEMQWRMSSELSARELRLLATLESVREAAAHAMRDAAKPKGTFDEP